MWLTQAINYLFFVLEALTIVVAVVVAFAFIIGLSSKGKAGNKKGRLIVRSLNAQYQKSHQQIAQVILSKNEHKKLHKAHVKADKCAQKRKESKPNVFVISFNGDMKASQGLSLAEEVNAILQIATSEDEVVIKLESPGGTVNGYGLAAAQLARIKQANIKLTAVIDQVAASGGYMMASVADKIIASPFAIIGSIGVVAQLPNINRFLQEKGVDIELHTAGEHKRTLTMLGKNTEEGREKFKEQLEAVHQLFKAHIAQFRTQVDIDKISTGEYWFGQSALSLNLVDELMASDQYLLEKYQSQKYQIFQVSYYTKKSKIGALQQACASIFQRTNIVA